jgi:hypothetical protein
MGAALKTGFTNARGTFVSYIPGDGQVPMDQVVKLYNEIDGADIILSARQVSQDQEEKPRTPFREFLTLVLRYLLIAILGFDHSGKEGIFVIRNKILQQLRLTANTGLVGLEIQIQCYRNNCEIKESTITIQPRMSGHSKMTNIPTYLYFLWEVLKLRFTL